MSDEPFCGGRGSGGVAYFDIVEIGRIPPMELSDFRRVSVYYLCDRTNPPTVPTDAILILELRKGSTLMCSPMYALCKDVSEEYCRIPRSYGRKF